jgi:hypothetical protein
MKSLSEIDRISISDNCVLYQTPHTSVSSDKMILQYICSEQSERIIFHRKLRVYRSQTGFYVIVRGTRCYVDDLMHKWFYK